MNVDYIIGIIGFLSALIGIPASIEWFYNKTTIVKRNSMSEVKEGIKPIFSIFNLGIFSRLTMKQAVKSAKSVAKQIELSEFNPTIILGIGRGGAIFGSLVSYNLYHIPVVAIDREYNWEGGKKRIDNPLYEFDIPKKLRRRILLVAGEAHTGGTMDRFIDYLHKNLEVNSENIQTCVFYKQTVCTVDITYSGVKGENVVLMPWQDSTYIRDSLNRKEAERLAEKQKKIINKKSLLVYIVRHAETEENIDGDRFIGETEAKLSEKGKLQANATGKYISQKVKNVDVIYSSPKLRCIDTANIINNFTKSQIIIKDELKEMNYGVWENMKRVDVQNEYSEMYLQYTKNPCENHPTNGESVKDVIKRIQTFLDNLLMKMTSEKQTIVIVTHKTTGRLMLCELSNESYLHFRKRKLDNASISKVLINGDEFNVELENHIGHLTSME
jgi:probable phosphoglycerate mutase